MDASNYLKYAYDSAATSNPAIKKILDSATSSVFNKAPEYTKERAFLTRPRSTSNDRNDRGQICYIRLMTSNDQRSKYSSGSSSRLNAYKGVVKQELSESLKVMAGNSGSIGYDSFLISNISASMDEKLQIVEVFGDNEVAYYFGRAPMVFNISGTLMDSVDTGWFTKWVTTYAAAMRGTELARNFELLKIVLPNMTLIGSMVNFRWDQSSNNDVLVPFSFQFYVKQLIPTPVTPVNAAITNAAESINFSTFKGMNYSSWKDMIGVKNGGLADLGMGATTSVVSTFLDGLSSSITSTTNDILNNSMFKSITSGLVSIRTSLFAPIYGVMNSLTRLVKNVFGSLTSIFNALTAPIRNILGDISRIASMATSLINMTISGIVGFGRGLSTGFGVYQNYLNAVKSIQFAAGVITSAPQNVSSGIRQAFNYGFLPTTSAFLQANSKAGLSSAAKLSARPGAALNKARSNLSPQLAILSSTPSPATLGAAL